MEVNVHHAKTHLSKLIAAVEAGEEVIIARNGKPAVRLSLVEVPAAKRPREFGRLAGKLNLPENWEEEWDKMDEEITFLMETGDDLDDPLTGIPDYTGTPFEYLNAELEPRRQAANERITKEPPFSPYDPFVAKPDVNRHKGVSGARRR